MSSANCSHIITRNLARIMNLRVVQIDTDARLLTFLYSDPTVLSKVRQELCRIGFPVLSLSKEHPAARKEELMAG